MTTLMTNRTLGKNLAEGGRTHEWRQTSTQDVLDYIDHHVFQQVLEESEQTIPIRTSQSAIRMTTPGMQDPEFRLEPDGTIWASQPHMLENKLRAPESFQSAWKCLEDHLAGRILHQMEQDGIYRESNKWDNPDLDDPDDGNQKDPDEQRISLAVQKAARVLAGSLSNGYPRNPSRLGAHYLHGLIGTARVSEALRIAGGNATIRDHNLIAAHRECFQEAHRQNPNAVVLWFARKGNELPPGEPSPNLVISQAREMFIRWLGAQGEPCQEEWDTFCGMNRQAINHFPPATRGHQTLIEAIMKTGVQPPYSIIRHLVKGPYRHRNCDENLLELVRASGLSRRERGSTLGELMLKDEQDRTITNGSSPAPDGRRKSPGKTGAPGPRTAWKASRKDLIRMLEGPTGTDLLESIRETVQVETVPREYVELRLQDQTEPTLRVERTPGRAIRLRTNGTWSPDLPLMRGKKLLADWTTRGQWAKAVREMGAGVIRRNWKTHGPDAPMPSRNRCMRAVTEYLHERGINEQSISQPLRDGLETLLSPHILRLAKAILPVVTIHRYNLACLGQEGLDHLIRTNPGTLIFAFRYAKPQEEIEHPGQVIELARTTLTGLGAGNTCWRYISQTDPDDMRRITGELDAQQAADMLRMSARHQALPATRVFRAISRLQKEILHDLQEDLREDLRDDLRDNSLEDEREVQRNRELLEQNLDVITRLAFQESARRRRTACGKTRGPESQEEMHDEMLDDIQRAWDYTRTVSRDRQALPSRTWAGLMRRSDRWHQGFRTGATLKEWETILAEQDGRSLAWNSALPEPLRDGEYTIAPLTSQEDLRRESIRMEHCVIHYGSRCASGKSRIFSVSRLDRTVATIELGPAGSKWGVLQARGVRNHPVNPDVLQAAERTAGIYERALRDGFQHDSWWVQSEDNGGN